MHGVGFLPNLMNKKLLVRIIAIALAVATVVALFVPVVMATEEIVETSETEIQPTNSTEENPIPSQTIAPPDEETFPEEENPELGNVPVDTVPLIEEDPIPDTPLPDGFEYVKEGDSWVAAPMDGTPSGIQLIVSPEFNAEEITVFFGNLDSKRVQVMNLTYNNNYIDVLDLEPGYYVVYSGNYAYADDYANTYEINGGKPLYVYVGDIKDFNNLKYSAEFTHLNNFGMLNVPMSTPSEFANVIDYGNKVNINNVSFAFPTEYDLVDNSIPTVTENTNTPSQQIDETLPEKEEEEIKKKDSLFVMTLKRIWFPVLLLICGQVCLIVIKYKKEDINEKRIENDHNDSGRFE